MLLNGYSVETIPSHLSLYPYSDNLAVDGDQHINTQLAKGKGIIYCKMLSPNIYIALFPLPTRLRNTCGRGSRRGVGPRDNGQLQGNIIFYTQLGSCT